MMKSFWLSWKHYPELGAFELHFPWWISGEGEDHKTVVAAVKAENEVCAKDIVMNSFDIFPSTLEWRFCDERLAGWSPFCDRFSKADWMEW